MIKLYHAAGDTLAPPLRDGRRLLRRRHLIGIAIGWGRKAFPESAVLDAYVARCQARPAARPALELDETSGLQRAA